MPTRTDRIKSLGERSRFRIGTLLVQPDRLVIDVGGEQKSLTLRAMEVLVVLAEHAEETLSAEHLLIEIWRCTAYSDNPVQKAIRQIREAIGDDIRNPRYIETIHKRGYRVIAPVTFPEDYRRSAAQADGWISGNPFVGLSAFDAGHAGMFFGRSRATAELLTAMRRQIDSQRRLVLVIGASGCGKTSLLRAGAIPLLRHENGFDGLRTFSHADCDLSLGGQIIRQLAAALADWTLAEWPVFSSQSVDELAHALREHPAMVTKAVAEAFRRIPEREIVDRPYAHLLLTIDHAEALVASPDVDAEERAAFDRVLEALCSTPRVLTTIIARSDFYPRLVEALPAVAERKQGDGHVDVFTPRSGEIAQIIRAPALRAGLSFEQDAKNLNRLDDTLRDAALAQPDALPLLQHTLHMLYERRSDTGLLTYAAYREIGGLEGALAHRAETVYSTSSENARERLDALLSKLVVIQPDSDNISARRLLWSSLDDDGARELVENFIRARLFVGELNDHRPGFGVAHEALLRQWPRASDWAEDNQRLLRARARLQRAADRWTEEGCSEDHLLNPGRPLAEAIEAAQRLPDQLGAVERNLLAASQRHWLGRRRLRRSAIAALIVLTIVSSVLAVSAIRSREETELRRAEAVSAQGEAVRQRDEAQRNRKIMVRLSDLIADDPAYALDATDSATVPAERMQRDIAESERQYRTQLAQNRTIDAIKTMYGLGDLFTQRGHYDAANTVLLAADNLASRQRLRTPNAIPALEAYALGGFYLGQLRHRSKQFNQAKTYWERYLTISRDIAGRAHDQPYWIGEIGYAHNVLGTLARDMGDLDGALKNLTLASAHKRIAKDKGLNDFDFEFGAIDTDSWIASTQETLGSLEMAAQGHDRQIANLLALEPPAEKRNEWQLRLANYLHISGKLALLRGDTAKAGTDIGETIRLLEDLGRRAPQNQEWRRYLAEANLDGSEIARLKGDRASVFKHILKAYALMVKLQPASRSQPGWRRLDATVRYMMARYESGEEGKTAMREAIDDLASLAAAHPDDYHIAIAYAESLIVQIQRKPEKNDAAARSDWLRVERALGRHRSQLRDVRIRAVLARVALALGREDAREHIAYLDRAGYRHPDFNVIRQSAGYRTFPHANTPNAQRLAEFRARSTDLRR